MVKKSTLTAVENKILDISSLATKSALTAVENKIPDVSTLVKKTDYNTKISGLATNSSLTAVENKIPDVTDLVTKTEFDAKLKAVSDRVAKNKSKNLLFDNELKRLKTFDAAYFRGKQFFGTDGLQKSLVFQPMPKYLKKISGLLKVSEFRSKRIYKEVIKSPKNTLAPEMGPEGRKMHLKFDGSCLKTTEKYFYFPTLIE